eukprot:Plantae.Rhodophyta-Palmaria_palmata.ctg7023.p5 GENE.Plantae.Rhodophyta-Palmaria_palmata.ctg7023~~Plantae.Rhodophyta-Palmaria_palmata.ctg7023.p5  ORF type:complete len:110 (+),score=12.20 Plantae.Rhodophyta-Palmaria_palmata.ctg7023:1005-1334(+)
MCTTWTTDAHIRCISVEMRGSSIKQEEAANALHSLAEEASDEVVASNGRSKKLHAGHGAKRVRIGFLREEEKRSGSRRIRLSPGVARGVQGFSTFTEGHHSLNFSTSRW